MSILDLIRDKTNRERERASRAWNAVQRAGQSAGNFARKYPTPVSYVSQNKQTIRNYPAPQWMNRADRGLRRFSQAAENAPRFNFADRFKTGTGRTLASIPQQILNIPSNTASTVFKDYGKVNVKPSYLLGRAGEAAERGLDIGSLIGGGSLLKQGLRASKPSVYQLMKMGAKTGMRQGAGYGAGYGITQGLQSEGDVRQKLMQAARNIPRSTAFGAGFGGLLGGLTPAISAGTKSISKDLVNILKNRVPREIIPAHSINLGTVREGLEDAIVNSAKKRGLKPQKGWIDGDINIGGRLPRQTVKRYETPETLREIGRALPRPGMTIKEVGKKKNPLIQEGEDEIKRVAANILKNNPNEAITQRDAEAMARDVIANRPFNKPKSPLQEGGNKLIQEARKYKSAEEFKKAVSQADLMDLSNPKQHRIGRIFSDSGDSGIMDTTAVVKQYGKDLQYTPEANVPMVKSPNEMVTIYRSANKAEGSKVVPGDYVSFSKDYANSHNRGKLITQKVPAKDVIWQGNDFNEWVYSPESIRKQYPNGLTDIWNQSQSLQEGVNPLIQEARKYKSAEEFAEKAKFKVKLSELTPTEGHTPEAMKGKLPAKGYEKDPIRVEINKDGKLQIQDGNRRYYQALERGDKDIEVVFNDQAPMFNFEGEFDRIKNIWNKSQPLQEGVKSTPPFAKSHIQSQEAPTTIPKQQTDLQKNVSSFYNLNRLKISQRAKQGIQNEISNAGRQLKQTVGTKLSNKEVLDIADTSSKILNTTINREQTSAKIAANLNLRRKIAQVSQSGKIDKEFVDMWIKDKAAGEDIARQLQARRIVADPEEAKTINIVLDAIYKQNKNADEIIKASKGVDFNNPEQVTKLYRQFVKPKAEEWLDILRYNSMLSSPNTHIINTASNLEGTAIITPIEKTITGMLDAVKSGFTGKQRQYYAGEGKEYLKGYLSSVGDATSRFIKVMRGESMNLNPDIRNIPLTKKGTLGRTVENTLSVPIKALEGMDQFFTALTEGGVKKSLAYRASKLGKPITDVENIAKSEATQRLFRATENPNQGVLLDGIDQLTNTLMRLRNSDNTVVKLMARFTFPFVRTPTNLFKQGIEYSPMGVTTLLGAKNKTEQLAKIIIGSASAAGAAMLLGQDRLTWAEPTNAKRKSEFRSAGRQPYSVKVGDKWISYSKLHPAIAFNLALVSALDDAQKNKKLSEDEADTVLSAFAKVGNFLVDQSYLRNMGDFLGAVKGDEEKYTSYFSNYPQQLIPFKSLMGWVTRIVDPVQRKIDTDGTLLEKQMQQVMMSIPGLSQNVPAREDQFGGAIPNQNRLFNALSPNRMTTERPEYEQYYQQSLQQSKYNAENKQIREMLKSGEGKGDVLNTPIERKLQVASGLDYHSRGPVVLDMLKQKDPATLQQLVDKKVLTDGLVTNMFENGTINAKQALSLKKYIKVRNLKKKYGRN